MAGLVPAIDVLGYLLQRKTWMPATDIGITLCDGSLLSIPGIELNLYVPALRITLAEISIALKI